MGSSFIHLIRIDSNEFFLMAEHSTTFKFKESCERTHDICDY